LKKIIKYSLIAIAVVSLVISQLLLLKSGDYPLGALFAILFLIFLYIPLSNTHEKIIDFLIILKRKTEEIRMASVEAAARPESARTAKKGGDAGALGPDMNAGRRMTDAVKGFLTPSLEKMAFSFSIPKMAFIIAAVALLGLVQVLLFSHHMFPAFLLLALDAYFAVRLFVMKEKSLVVSLTFEKGMKFLAISAGALLILIGWLLLINRDNNVQNYGVLLTTIGIFGMFWGLPENEMAFSGKEENTDILLNNYPLLNNIFTKIVLVVAAFIIFSLGARVMANPESSIYSMIFYAAGIGLVFLSLPWINFNDQFFDNKWFNVFKLAGAAVAVYLAFLAQKAFMANKEKEAVILYLAAGFLFIILFPIYKKREVDMDFPIKLEYIFLGAIILVGIFLRVYQLDVRPFGLENDESAGMVSLVKNFWVGQHPIYAYIQEFIYSIFGYNRIGMRMSGVVMGVIAIPIMYFALRVVFGPRVAMLVTTIFTFTRWNLHYGRSGHGTILMTVAESMAVYFILKAIEKRSKLLYFMAGVGSGMCWYGLLTGWFIVVTPVVYFVLEGFRRPDFIKKNRIGIIVFMLGFWLFASQHIKNYFISTNIYFSRINEVSVFSQDPNAPRNNPAKGVVDNTQRVLEMFNFHGDSRQRNSGGQPNEPTIDFTSSMFFALGFIYCIYYSKYYLSFIMVMIFFSQAAGSIFSIEAPSAMRAMGTTVPVMFFIGIIFERLWMAVKRVFGAKSNLAYLILVMIPLVFIVKDNWDQYFNRWVGGLDELSTAAGMYAQKLEKITVKRDLKGDFSFDSECAKDPDKCWRIFLFTSWYYPGHPPFRIFRWDEKVDSSKDFVDNFLVLSKVEKENYAIFLHPDTWDTKDFFAKFFPGCTFEEFSHPCCGKMFEVCKIKNSTIQEMRGLTGVITGPLGTETIKNDMPEFTDANAAKVPYKAVWNGIVFLKSYCSVQMANDGNARASISIDGTQVDTDKTAKLAKGFHTIKISAYRQSAADKLKLSMMLKRYEGSQMISQEKIPLDKNLLYTCPNTGLHVYFYSGNAWKNIPVNSEEILPEVFISERALDDGAAEMLSGKIKITTAGDYNIIPAGNGYFRVLVDNRYFTEVGAVPAAINDAMPPGARKVSSFSLSPGRHDIRIYGLNSSRITLTWSTPASRQTVKIPFDVFEPDYRISELK
jgi:hypothetical protein